MARQAATKPAPKFNAHYISGTHWDREWYRPFQEFRFLLVKLIDELIELMEMSKDFKYFQLDGQTCVLDDYVQIRPENKARLAKLITDGRILIGPWYTMPDLFCPGDEAFIRNLLLGRRISKAWGVEPMPVGFICDMFGHPSQMPQIFNGFGYKDCVLGRGTNEHTTPPFFTWEGPDGSQVFTFKLQDSQGYGAFALPRAALEEETFVRQYMKEMVAELEAAGDDQVKKREVQEKWFRIELAKYVDHEIKRANSDVLCLMDSMDHILPATDVARYLRLIKETNAAVVPQHSNLPAFFADARAAVPQPVVRRGELREPAKSRCGYLWLIPNCVSARVRIKQANDHCQVLLERWAEPLLALANLHGAKLPESYLHSSWEHVLTNHAHDSICGCSIDQVHRDMLYRFDQARQMAEQLRHQAVGALTATSVDLAKAKDEFTLTLVNPLPTPRDEVVVFDIDLPLDYPAQFAEGFFVQTLKSFAIEDAAGKLVPFQRLAFLPAGNERSRFARFSFMSDGEYTRYTVAARVALPGLGFTSLKVRPAVMPERAIGTLRTGATAAANEHLAIAIDNNGTLVITDKASGSTYTGLLTFEDRSEVGDGWFHSHSLNDEQYLSTACPAQVSVVHDGPEIVTFAVRVVMSVPARYDWKAERGVPERVDLVITSRISLRRGARVVDVETTVDNTAEDHRLRVLFPTDVTDAQTYLAHHPYDLVERSIALDPATSTWQETEQAEKPFLGLQAVGRGQRGLAFLGAGGLHEGGVVDDQRRTMQVTLLRSFRKTVSTGGEGDGLEKGKLVYRYALMPYAGSFPAAAALAEQTALATGLLVRQTGKRPSGYPAMSGTLPSTRSFLQLTQGKLVVSAIKPREGGGGLVVRVWNPTGKVTSDQLVFWTKVAKVQVLNLAEDVDPKAPAPKVTGAKVDLRVQPHAILTLAVTLA